MNVAIWRPQILHTCSQTICFEPPAAKQRRKAEFYHRFTTLEKRFKNWKLFTKQEKEKRARKKWIKAVVFDENRLMR